MLGEIFVTEQQHGPNGLTAAIPVTAGFRSAEYRRHVWQMETGADGDCVLFENLSTLCVACLGICVGEGLCEPFPTYASAGAIQLSGLRIELTLLADSLSHLYQAGAPDELFGPADTIVATAQGETIPCFSLATSGVAPLDFDVGNGKVWLAATGNHPFSWTAANGDSRVLITLRGTPGAAHGSPSQVIIECDVPDTGYFEVPEAMIAALPDTSYLDTCGFSFCELSSIMRYSRAQGQLPSGHVSLFVGNTAPFWAIHSVGAGADGRGLEAMPGH